MFNSDPKDSAVPVGLDFEGLYSCRRSHQYGDKSLSVGQLVKLNPNAIKNEALVRLGFLVAVSKDFVKKRLWSECGRCGEKFLTMQSRDNHVKETHIAPATKIPTIDELPRDKAEALINAPIVGERIRDGRAGGEGVGSYVRRGEGAEVVGAIPGLRELDNGSDQAPVFFENTVASRAVGEGAVIEVQGKGRKKGLKFNRKRGENAELR